MALSPEETVQADTAMARVMARDAVWLSHMHTEDKPVEWAGFNAYFVRQEASTSAKDTGGIWSTYRCATCPPWHGTNDTRLPGKYHEDLWNAIRTSLSRPTALSYVMFVIMAGMAVVCNGATLTAGNLWCCIPEWCIRWYSFLGASGRWWRHQVWIFCSLQPSEESLA